MVSLDFIEEKYRKKIRLEEEMGGYSDLKEYSAYYDITEYIGNLPQYIDKVEIKMTYVLWMESDEEPEDFDKEQMVKIINKINDGMKEISEGFVKTVGEPVLITFVDGRRMEAWNSEWGGVNFL